MRVLKLIQFQFKLIGVVFTHKTTSIWFKLYGCFCFFILSMMLEPQLVYLWANFNDFQKATDVFIQISVETFTMYKMVVLVKHRNVITMLLQTIQADCDRMQLDIMHTNHLVRANHKAAQVTRINNAIVVLAGIAHTGGPLMIMLNNYVRGTFHRDLMVLPWNGMYYRYLAYVLNILYNVYIGLPFTNITTLFVGLCLLGMGYMENLSAHFTELCEKYEQFGNNRKMVRHEQQERYLHDEIVKGISEHYKILQLLDMFAVSVSGIVFAQYTGNIIVLSTVFFQASLSSGETMLMYVIPCIAVIGDLFLFSYFGSLLTDKCLEVHDSIYQTKWYLYPITEQRHIQLLLLRLQKPFILHGYGYVNCTLQSFVQVLRTVCSVLTVLQSIDLSK